MPELWSYERAMDWLNSRTNYEKKWPSYGTVTFNLDRMRRLCALVGNPQDRYPTIHITGTKGKGSTAAMIESILRAAGLRTGLYTSPHLVSIEERIRLNGQDIPKQRLPALLERIYGPVERIRGVAVPPHPTFFEIFTTAGFLYFADEKVDWGVIEVGLGGRLDSTNIITPEVSVVTRVGLDHMNILGDTVGEIATEKAGIIKEGVPVVIGPQEKWPDRVLRGRAGSLGATIWGVGREIEVSAVLRRENVAQPPSAGISSDVSHPPFPQDPEDGSGREAGAAVSSSAQPGAATLHAQAGAPVPHQQQPQPGAAAPHYGYRFNVKTPFAEHGGLEVPLVGEHQVENAAVAVGAIDALRSHGKLTLDENAIVAGLARVEVAARVEVMSRSPLVVVDGAHNPISMHALIRAVRENFSPKRIVLLYAMATDKDIAASLDVVLPLASEAFFTLTNSPRAAKPETLASLARSRGLASVHVERDTALAFKQALAATGPDDLLLITGSLYLAGDLRPVILEVLKSTKS